jgi:hypothetical protein
VPDPVDVNDVISENLLKPGGIAPNQYHLQGGGLSITYYPGGAGPIPAGHGPTCVYYQDSTRHLAFDRAEVQTTDLPDLGEILNVTIANTVDLGYTTFSLLLPAVTVANELGTPVAVQTIGITTLHRSFLAGVGDPQRDSFTTVALTGSASNGPVPL